MSMQKEKEIVDHKSVLSWSVENCPSLKVTVIPSSQKAISIALLTSLMSDNEILLKHVCKTATATELDSLELKMKHFITQSSLDINKTDEKTTKSPSFGERLTNLFQSQNDQKFISDVTTVSEQLESEFCYFQNDMLENTTELNPSECKAYLLVLMDQKDTPIGMVSVYVYRENIGMFGITYTVPVALARSLDRSPLSPLPKLNDVLLPAVQRLGKQLGCKAVVVEPLPTQWQLLTKLYGFKQNTNQQVTHYPELSETPCARAGGTRNMIFKSL